MQNYEHVSVEGVFSSKRNAVEYILFQKPEQLNKDVTKYFEQKEPGLVIGDAAEGIIDPIYISKYVDTCLNRFDREWRYTPEEYWICEYAIDAKQVKKLLKGCQ